jgi:hypothetical protein
MRRLVSDWIPLSFSVSLFRLASGSFVSRDAEEEMGCL